MIKDNTTFDSWINAAHCGDIQGYAIACVGTKRSQYWAFKGGWTYKEKEAQCLPKKEAGEKLARMRKGNEDIWNYMRLVAIRENPLLPTINGYPICDKFIQEVTT